MALADDDKTPNAIKPTLPDSANSDSPLSDASSETNVTADPLNDGTIPTVLATNQSNQPSVAAPKLHSDGISKVYRRADIMTSFLTLIITLAVVALILGIYLFVTKKPPLPPPKVTTLDQAEISKFGGFLTSNSVGSAAEILTVSSSSLFKGRLALDNDIKVTGNGDFSGSVSTTSLSVHKNSSLSNTNINGNLTVSGQTNIQGPAVLAGAASIGQNLAVAGNGSFGGALSAGVISTKNLTVTGDLNLSGHLVISGSLPTVTAEAGAGTGANSSVEGNDSGGTIIINTGTTTMYSNGQNMLVSLKFHTPYAKTPHVLLTAVGPTTAASSYYVLQTPNGFNINLLKPPLSNNTYSFNYWVIQ